MEETVAAVVKVMAVDMEELMAVVEGSVEGVPVGAACMHRQREQDATEEVVKGAVVLAMTVTLPTLRCWCISSASSPRVTDPSRCAVC